MSPATQTILKNQQPDRDQPGLAGPAGRARSRDDGTRRVLAKPLANGDVAVALFNQGGATTTISTTAAAIGKTGSSFTLRDAWTNATSDHHRRDLAPACPPTARWSTGSAAAAPAPPPPPPRALRRRRVRPLPGRAEQHHRQRHPADHLGLQRRRQPAVDAQRPDPAGARQVPGRADRRHRRQPRSSSGTATAAPTSSGPSTPTAPSAASASGLCLDVDRQRHRQRHPGDPVDLHGRGQPALDARVLVRRSSTTSVHGG